MGKAAKLGPVKSKKTLLRGASAAQIVSLFGIVRVRGGGSFDGLRELRLFSHCPTPLSLQTTNLRLL